ncbi:MAG: hypothetical protein ACOC47_04420 [Alkalispirochaetaceae bacterium]
MVRSLAEVVLFDNPPYPVAAVATGDANLVRLPRRELNRLKKDGLVLSVEFWKRYGTEVENGGEL